MKDKKKALSSREPEDSIKDPLLPQILPKLRPFQREAFEFAVHGKRFARQWDPSAEEYSVESTSKQELNPDGRLLIADEMGLGKTVTSLAIMSQYEAEWPLLVLCPASLRYTWPTEIEKFLPVIHPSEIYVAKGFADTTFLLDERWSRLKVVVVTYSLFQNRSAVQQALCSTDKQRRFRCIIADESHHLKSRTSQRTKLLLPLLQSAKRLLLLSGTPALARPAELWPQLAALRPDQFKTWTVFANRYCNPRRKRVYGSRFIVDYSGASNLAELHGQLQNIMVRRLKSAVLHELPPKQRSCVPIAIAKSCEVNCCHIMKELDEARASVDNLVEGNNPDLQARRLLMKAYQATGIGKAPSVAEYLLDWLEGSGKQKILVFAHHAKVLDTIEQALLQRETKSKGGNAPFQHMRLDGTVHTELRAQRVRQFQTCPKVRVALLSVTAAGVGLTLTAATTVLFAELHWTPGVLAQAEDRAHRLGQVNAVQIVYMVSEDPTMSIDPSLWGLLGRKIKTLDQLVNGSKVRDVCWL